MSIKAISTKFIFILCLFLSSTPIIAQPAVLDAKSVSLIQNQEGKDAPPDQPNMKTEEVASWLILVLKNINTYNYEDYQSKFQLAENFFTAKGWSKYMDDVKMSHNLDAVIERKMQVTATQVNQPNLIAEGTSPRVFPWLSPGVYYWTFEVRITNTYQVPPYDNENTYSMNLLCTVVVYRQPLAKNANGLGIESLQMKFLSE